MNKNSLNKSQEKTVTNMAKRYYNEKIKDNQFKNNQRKFGIEIEFFITNKDNILQIQSSPQLSEKLKEHAIIPEYGSYQIEINPKPYRLHAQSYKELYDEIQHIRTLAEKILKKQNYFLIPIGIPFSIEGIDFNNKNIITPKERYLISTNYFHKVNKLGSNLYFSNDETINLPGNSGLSIINELHIHLQALNAIEIIKLFNYSQMITAPFVSISANSGIVNNKKLIHKDFQLSVFSQAEGLFDGPKNIARVGLFSNYISSLNDYFEKILAFKPLYYPQDKLDQTAFESILSKYFGWTRIRISYEQKRSIRIEFRPMSTQPTILENIALTEFYINSLLSLIENDYTLLPHQYLKKNFDQSMKNGMNAKLFWDIGCGIQTYPVHQILNHLFELTNKGSFSEIITNRIAQKKSPIDRILKETKELGYQKAIDHYKHSFENETPFIK